ncbi:MAG: ABC transporter permease [Rhizobiaceae bacterium]|jgi:polar amino acid transport system permease protein|nr:ABC transporter permease [Rhizobiaceae bacterium]
MNAMLTREFWQPHRIGLAVTAVVLVAWMAVSLRWDWLPKYGPLLIEGVWVTIWMLVVSCVLGMLLALPIGLVQVTGPWWLAAPARMFCTLIRGTPLLLQVWLLYYGLGSLFAAWPEIRQSWAWPYLRTAWPYGVVALTISFAAYEAEVMRGAFAGVPKGELEAARAYGMSPFTAFRRIWLPRALHRALPTLSGETVVQLKSTPLVATITVIDAYAVISRVRQDTFLTYEPLLFLALIYMILAGVLVFMFSKLEALVPVKGA